MRRVNGIAAWVAVAAALGTALAAGVTMASALASTITTSRQMSPLLANETAALQHQGLSSAHTNRAIEAQSEIARTDLVPKVEAGMAEAYAGTWFEPASAQLHIGATSPASRRIAEGIVSEAGVTAAVVTTVLSTWTQLLATQHLWNGKLAGLFTDQQVKTALDPQANAVIVTLSAAVPAAKRSALEDEASASDIKVLVEVVPSTQFNIVPMANGTCKAFAPNEAFCSKPLASGVSIENQTKVERCTSGPLTIGKDNERGNTYALTAGHCIARQGSNRNWLAFTTAGVGSVFGQSIASVYGQRKADYGDILIEQPGNWSEPGNIPVSALTAEWKRTASTTSYPVKGEQTPVAGFQDCHEGQTTGQSCGQIKAVQVAVTYGDGAMVEGMVEHKGANANGGDSGGPFLFIESNNEVLMEGILSAGVVGQGTTIYFTPLQTALRALNLELLTTANETRRGPYWRVGGSRLSSGTKQINLQVKGTSSIKSKVVGVAATVECGFATSEGAALEGNGSAQGQDKGALKFSECKVSTPAKCAVEPVKTVNTKSHLVTYEGSQSKYADLFEPQQGEVLATIKVINGTEKCAVAGEFPLKGSVAAEIIPKEAETQEALLNFPATPIEKVFLENKEKLVKLALGAEPAKLTAAFSAKLATGEPFGVFGT